MGDAKRRAQAGRKDVVEALGLETPGGRVQVRWDNEAAVTPFGQMAFFIEFLNLSGLWSRFVEGCPLSYTSPNASEKLDVLGTWLLSILSGHRRYAHVTAIRGDGVNPGFLGMRRVVSEDTLRRALSRIPVEEGTAWLREHLEHSVLPLLTTPWIMDVDTTVKPLYGKQEGAVVGYNPAKPGRPSHTYHTYLISGLRLVLEAEVLAGNESHASYTLPGLVRLIDGLPQEKRPYLVRGDAGFGSDPVMRELEARDQGYLFKLRLTKNVKRYIEKCFWEANWHDAGQGWEGRSGEIKLQGWDKNRRVVVLRHELKGEVILADTDQQELAFLESNIPAKRFEYAVLVTSLPHEVIAIAQLYRDRADAENSFDELKNQWGWGGFVTQDLHRCQFSARAVALVYNWWSLFVRLAHPKGRLEAITSRPLLLTAVGRHTKHAGQNYLTLTSAHGLEAKARDWLTRASLILKGLKQSAEQLNPNAVWQLICEHLCKTLTGIGGPKIPLLRADCFF